MNMMPKMTEPRDAHDASVDDFSIEIGLFDEADCEDGHRVVPLARYLGELRDLPNTQR
ncbi:MAG: hypothetical protein WAO88_14225 [Roseicyclus sp.]|uniref:hypothetical protein n=1 Tax=Roseicyclus sp. TaxID=1914329 RepID=UPI003BB0063B